MSNYNSLTFYKNNTYIQNDFFKEFFYDLYFQAISFLEKKERFLPIHVSCSCIEKNQEIINKEIDELILSKKNFICVKEFTNNKAHFHLVLLEPTSLFSNKEFYKKRKIVNILQFYNIVQYISKEVFINNILKKNNLVFFLKKNNKKYNQEELLTFIKTYVNYYE